jgi:repressor LexA
MWRKEAMENLTPNQLRVLRRIEEFIRRKGYSPTLDELAAGLRVSKPTVQQYLRALEEKRAIRRMRYAHRSIEPLGRAGALRGAELPLLGRIAAGEPIEAVEGRELLDVAAMLGLEEGRDLFLLRVKGDSMIEEGIHDGDYVVVEKRETARNGERVVALLPDDTATLKKFYREKDRIRLQPANPEMEPLYVRDVRIQGIVRGVFRPLT